MLHVACACSTVGGAFGATCSMCMVYCGHLVLHVACACSTVGGAFGATCSMCMFYCGLSIWCYM